MTYRIGVQRNGDRKGCRIARSHAIKLAIAAGLVFSVYFWGLGTHAIASDMIREVSAGLRHTLLPESENPVTKFQEAEDANKDNPVSEVYRFRQFQPIWIESQPDGFPIGDQARALISLLHTAEEDGLAPEDYHLSTIRDLLESVGPVAETSDRTDRIQRLVQLDILLTEALIRYSFHLSNGRVDPETIDSLWFSLKTDSNILDEIGHAVESRTITETIDRLKPSHPGYYRLRHALRKYREIQNAGGWVSIPEGETIRPGSSENRIRRIRSRLQKTGDISTSTSSHPSAYDDDLVSAVKRFQHRHGIDSDGLIGPRTIREMNVTVEERVRQMEVNLERWRWLAHDFGEKHILVNIADYSLTAVDKGEPVLNMRVVVGQAYRRTPVFSERLRYLEINPYWNIPEKIAVEDKLPIIKKNPDYLKQQNIQIYSGWNENSQKIDPVTVDWSRFREGYFPYRLRQEPGPLNALGTIKFMFPNRFSVYLHDTPQRNLFNRTLRGFSSGCIRIEKPVDLAVYALSGNPGWNQERIVGTIRSGRTKVVHVRDEIMVHLLYWTAWVDETGVVHFRDDIYDRDFPLWQAIESYRSISKTGAGKLTLHSDPRM